MGGIVNEVAVVSGSGQEKTQKNGLSQGKVVGALSEVKLTGFGQAIHIGTPFSHIEIKFQDTLFRQKAEALHEGSEADFF
jgi:hypothetical protein